MLQKFTSKIIEKKNLAENVKKIILSIPKGFNFKAGQYVLLEHSVKDQIQRRAYSIASSPDGNPENIELCIKKIAPEGFAHELFKSKLNSEIKVIGPAGKFFIDSNPEKQLVFIAVGTGIAPFKSMIEYLLKELGFKKQINLIHGYRHEEDILYKEFFSTLEKQFPNFKQHIILSQPKKQNKKIPKGHVQDFIDKLVQKPKESLFYICGMKQMIYQVSEKINSLKVNPGHISFEKYD